jgi:hypothetical protein
MIERDRLSMSLRFPTPVAISEAAEIEEASAEKRREPAGETDHEPFHEIERLKKDASREFPSLPERGEDFDGSLACFHSAIPNNRATKGKIALAFPRPEKN